MKGTVKIFDPLKRMALDKGDRVEFDSEQRERGFKAVSVKKIE
ncbi:MAG: hypothetical protein R6W73_03830 [Candidatus Saliniplasma sp.]